MYLMLLRDGTRFSLDHQGYVVARSDGPRDFDYGKGWQIVGFKTRHNARNTIPLAEAAARLTDGESLAAVVGQGWVIDCDHGTYRLWGAPRGRKLAELIALAPTPEG